ncbi:TPA: hypothetical protein MC918_004510 [Klebsiella pneumoniae]|nr:hypothetical protein [Klebsiella pneumoniae]
MNNCCDNAYQDGGTINEPQILNPEVIGGILKGVALQDGVKLDELTAIDLASQLCPKLQECILQAIDGQSFKDLTLENTTFRGSMSFDTESAVDVVNAICQHMTDCVIGIIKDNVIDAVRLTNLSVDKLGVTGGITLDADSAKAVADAVAQYLDDHIVEVIEGTTLTKQKLASAAINGLDLTGAVTLDETAAVNIADAIASHLDEHIRSVVLGGVLDSIKLANASIAGLALTGGVTLDATAAKSLVEALCPEMDKCITDALKANVLTGLTIDAPKISGAVELDEDAGTAIAEAIQGKVKELVDAALTDGTLCCLHLKGATIDNSEGSNNTWTDTTLAGTTTVTGELILGESAIADLCRSLTPCIDARFKELMNDLGRVYTDGKTITGNGTEDKPLSVLFDTDVDSRLLPQPTTADELPTTIIGDRTQLLGKPDYFIRVGEHILPAWKG